MALNRQLGDFLRSRRAALTIDDVGLPAGGATRRVTGLRRSEVAQLAGVSVEYYTRLEQGRAVHPSDQVLHALADGLRLDDLERRHLIDLARPAPTATGPAPAARVRPALRQMIEAMELSPAYVRDAGLDIVDGNALWKLVFPQVAALPRRERNMARWTLLDPAARDVWVDWEQVAREHARVLRVTAGAEPHNRRVAALVAELTAASPDFARWWGENRVHERTTGIKRIRHPVVGDLELGYEVLRPLADPGHTLLVYTAPRGSVSSERLRLLASWGATAPLSVEGTPSP
ncbi:helix-turn-helix transcriptional regulator [Actinoplanes sp. L3-i22]|uniref:helix-turn-helix transcriptional regulator n=1 Tax=Actinoplanes sp. L3-i22 TaxID=2836373 RepID=UPI001C78F978|nr:helix-turn-helix transcriptional regulator [Actinoplanes sp. L3-i22]BCY14655.1 transcriptional regulator [Actinoplanes sp. L3-i22]